MDRRYGLPGDYLSRSNPYTRLLMRNAGRANNGTDAGGLASVLSQGLVGYMYGQDRNAARDDVAKQAAAQQALVKGMMPSAGTPQGGHPGLMDVPAQPGSPGGYEGAVGALQGLEGNQYAGRLASDLMLKQYEAKQQAEAAQAAFDRQKELKASPGWAAPKAPVPGRDVPLPDDVFAQKRDLAAVEAAARVQPPGGYQRTQDGNGMEPIPGGPEDPGVVQERKRAEAQAKASVERESSFPKVKASLADFERKVETVTGAIDKALNIAAPMNAETGKREPNNWATGYGALLGDIPNTDAGALQGYLTTIKANLGFDTLQKMRESSPTGGALGSVSENENTLLQAINGALDPKQSESLVENLGIIRSLYPQVLAEKRAAFQSDYGDLMQAGSTAPSGVDPNVWEYMTPEEKALFKQ